MRINARAGALLLHDTYVRTYVRTPGAFWSVDLDIYIYIFKISMSHDLRVSSLASLARCNNFENWYGSHEHAFLAITRAMFNIQLTASEQASTFFNDCC